MKIVQLDNGKWAYQKGSLFRTKEYKDLVSCGNFWWRLSDNHIKDCLKDTKEEVEIALGWKWRQPPEPPKPVLSEPTQSILRAIEKRPQDFKLFERYKIKTYKVVPPTDFIVGICIDRKTHLKLEKEEELDFVGKVRVKYKNNKGISFTDDEHKAIEQALESLAGQRKEEQRRKKELEEQHARLALTYLYSKHE